MSAPVYVLYRWWDAEGKLLYIGKSMHVLARIASHGRYSKFFEEAATMTIERFPSKGALGEAEVAAIRAERPVYNIAHNREVEMPDDYAISPEMHELMCQAMTAALGPALARMKEAA